MGIQIECVYNIPYNIVFGNLMNNQLNKYLFSHIMGIWFIILGCLMAVIWLNQSLRILDIVIAQGASLRDFLLYSTLAAPLWLIITVPLSAFIAILWTLNRFLSDREIVVMHAVGLSPMQLSIAPIFFSVLLSALLFFNSLVLLPLFFSGFKTIQEEVRNTIPKLLIQENIFIDIDKDLTIFFGKKLSANAVGNVFIQDKRTPKTNVTFTAETGKFTIADNLPIVVLNNGQRTETSNEKDFESQTSNTLSFDSYTLNISRENQEQTASNRLLDANEESVRNLFNRDLAKSERFWRQRFAEGHYRLTSPLIVITLAITAVSMFFYRLSKQVSLAKRLTLAGLFGLAVQIAYIMSKSVVINYPFLWPIMYLVLIIPAVIGIIIIYSSSQKDRLLSFQLAEMHK